MKNTEYIIGQIVFEISINILTRECVIESQKILYAGKKGLYVEGNNGEWNLSSTEQTLGFYSKDKFDKEEIFSKSSCHFWTDTLVQAVLYKIEIEKILEIKKQLLSA